LLKGGFFGINAHRMGALTFGNIYHGLLEVDRPFFL
jgi:hypothetical protein